MLHSLRIKVQETQGGTVRIRATEVTECFPVIAAKRVRKRRWHLRLVGNLLFLFLIGRQRVCVILTYSSPLHYWATLCSLYSPATQFSFPLVRPTHFSTTRSSGEMKDNPFTKFLNSFTQSTRTPTARPPTGVPIAQSVNSTWENNFGARPKSTNTFSAKPDDLSQLGAVALPTTAYSDRPFTDQKPADERSILQPATHVSYLLTELTNLRDEDVSLGKEHSKTTKFSLDPTIPNFEERPFPLEHGNKPFSIVQLGQLVDELKFLRLINARPDTPDNLLEAEIIYLIQALPHVDTPNKLFQFLKLPTYLSHIETHTTNESIAPTQPVLHIEPQTSTTEQLED